MMELLFIISLIVIVAFLGKVIAKGLSEGENFSDYLKAEKQAKYSYKDYAYIVRKYGHQEWLQ